MNIPDIVEHIIQRYRDSGYPYRPFLYHSEAGISVEIRHPPIVPEFVRNKYTEVSEYLAASPSIERIELVYELQNNGIFTKLVERLLLEPTVDIVCVSNVYNEEFKDHLSNNSNWKLLELDTMPTTMKLNNCFYTPGK